MPLSLYASAEERTQVIAGLRAITGFLEGNPEVPLPRRVEVHVFPPAGLTDAEKRAEVDSIAARIGAGARESAGGHYIASIHFGSVEYSAIAIPCHQER
jgi:hypothetical protein